jgi:hypothetical protein
MAKGSKATEATGLCSNEAGVTACEKHAGETPGQWRPMRVKDAEAFERETGRKPACATCGDATGWVEVVPPTAIKATERTEATTLATEASTSPSDAKPRKAKKSKATASIVTLEQLAERYLAHLEEIGKSQGTLFSYKLEIVVALDELGAKTLVADLTPERVLAFNICDRVMRTRTGVAKARPTFEKTRRVLRQALGFAEETRLIAKAPLPEDAATH